MTSLFQRIRRQWNNPQSNHRRIAISLLTIGSFVMLGKLAGAGKEVALAWRYGVSERLDAYVFVFTLITLPTAIWFSALTLTLVPLVARAKQQDPSALQRFQREILGLSIVLSLALAGLVYLGLHWLLSQGWTGLTAPVLLHAQSLLGPLSVLLSLGFLISLLSAWLMARGFHRNTLLEAFPSLVLLLCLLAPQAWVPAPLIWGTLIGFVVQLAFLAWPVLRLGELRPPSLGMQSTLWKGFVASFGIVVLGQALLSFTGIFDQFFAARLGTGAISTLSYANRLSALVIGLGAMAIGRSILPLLSEMVGQGRLVDALAIGRRWAGFMFIAGCLGALAVWLFADFGVSLLFERGAFTSQDTTAVAELLRLLALQFPVHFAGIVFLALLSAQGRYKAIQAVVALSLALKVGVLLALTPVIGIYALPISTVLMYLGSGVAFGLLALVIGRSRNKANE